jgi:aminotransferase
MSTDRFVSRRVQAVPASGLQRFFDLAAELPSVISLGIGEPDFLTPEAIRNAGILCLQQGATAYTANAGMIELREALSAHLAGRYGLRYDPEREILITMGGSGAIQNTMLALIDSGDQVLIPEPCFVAYPSSVAFADGKPVLVPTSAAAGFLPDAAALEERTGPRTKALLLGYPSNPTGVVPPAAHLRTLAALAERRDLLVVSDEIYDRLVYGVEHHCFAALPGMRERTVLLGGFSKSYAMTGWRLGWLAAPAPLTEAVRKVQQYAIMCAPTISQWAGLEALRGGEVAVEAMRAEYDRRRRLVVDRLRDMGLPTVEPRGAIYCFPRVDGLGLSSRAFAERLLQEARVAVIPGEAFGPSGAGFVRLCYSVSMAKLEEALARMARTVAALRAA